MLQDSWKVSANGIQMLSNEYLFKFGFNLYNYQKKKKGGKKLQAPNFDADRVVLVEILPTIFALPSKLKKNCSY